LERSGDLSSRRGSHAVPSSTFNVDNWTFLAHVTGVQSPEEDVKAQHKYRRVVILENLVLPSSIEQDIRVSLVEDESVTELCGLPFLYSIPGVIAIRSTSYFAGQNQVIFRILKPDPPILSLLQKATIGEWHIPRQV